MKKIIILLACIALGLQVNAQDNGTSPRCGGCSVDLQSTEE